jgi:hypothetical protein
MAEGRRTALHRRRASQRTGPPTAAQVWSGRLAIALDALGAEGDRLEREYGHAALEVEMDQDEQKRARRRRDVWGRFGRKAGVGPPPSSFFGPD